MKELMISLSGAEMFETPWWGYEEFEELEEAEEAEGE